MKAFLSFVAGIAVGLAAHWYFTQPKSGATVAGAREDAHQAATEVKQTLKDTFDSTTLKDELAKTGKIIREKTRQAGEAIADATANARATAAIKTKLVEDSGLSAFKIDVDTTDGVVTLSGNVNSYEAVDRAMKVAMDTDGVYKVVSTLQVKPR